MSHAWIALGSNLGNRAATLSRAVELLEDSGVHALRISHLYETAPEHGVDEPPYLNAVLQAETDRDPQVLLELLLEIETRLGRSRSERNGPRDCDLDLLACGGAVLDEPGLTLPHPRMHHRIFVLVPLCELDPHWRHPVEDVTASDLLGRLEVRPGDVRLYSPFFGVGPDSTTGQDYPWRHLSQGRGA